MTVDKNVDHGLEKSGIDEEVVPDDRTERKVDEERVSEYPELVNLGGYEDRDPIGLSSGQQQRVAPARALVNEPVVLPLDGPLASLNRKLRKQMHVEFRQTHERIQGVVLLRHPSLEHL